MDFFLCTSTFFPEIGSMPTKSYFNSTVHHNHFPISKAFSKSNFNDYIPSFEYSLMQFASSYHWIFKSFPIARCYIILQWSALFISPQDRCPQMGSLGQSQGGAPLPLSAFTLPLGAYPFKKLSQVVGEKLTSVFWCAFLWLCEVEHFFGVSWPFAFLLWIFCSCSESRGF